MRALVPTALILAGLTLAACAGPGTANSAPSSPAPTPSSATSPSPTQTQPFTFPAHTKDELVRAEFRNGQVTNERSHPLTKAGSYVVKATCDGTGVDFAYEVTINEHPTTSGTFPCGHVTINTVGNLSAGDRIHITLTKVVAPFEAWAIVVPDPVG